MFEVASKFYNAHKPEPGGKSASGPSATPEKKAGDIVVIDEKDKPDKPIVKPMCTEPTNRNDLIAFRLQGGTWKLFELAKQVTGFTDWYCQDMGKVWNYDTLTDPNIVQQIQQAKDLLPFCSLL